MAEIRPRDIYRGRRRYRRLVTILLFSVALVIVVAIALFYYLQRYIVFESDGLRLALPFLEPHSVSATLPPDGGTDSPAPVPVDIELVAPDFSGVERTAGFGASELRAVLVTADKLNDRDFPAQLARLEQTGLSAMVLEVKPPAGPLAYLSETPITASYGTGGSFDLQKEIDALREQGVYLVAMISVCADELMALRNPPLALRDREGGPLGEDDTFWLDPYNRAVSAYAQDIMTELAAMGFDEILLTNLAHPKSAEVIYSQQITSERNSVVAVSSLALRLTRELRALDMASLRREPLSVTPTDGEPTGSEPPGGEAEGEADGDDAAGAETDGDDATSGEIAAPGAPPRISVLLDADDFRSGADNTLTGASPELFFKIFDRVYIYTSAESFAADLEKAAAVFGAEANGRFVPFVYNQQERGGYVLR